MGSQLTILIPNYERPKALACLLGSVFGAIRYAGGNDRVKVLVVDDHSKQDISEAIAPYVGLSNFNFTLQRSRCGNAETAFLSALDQVETEYVWLFGNDDLVSQDGIGYLLHVLDATAPGFVLLNPYINSPLARRGFVPITATAASVIYRRTEDLFLDFGFATTTTTFSCQVMRTDPVRRFHQTHRLTEHAKVYSHTFTMFGALRGEPGLFLSAPVVGFTGTDAEEELSKLQRQATSRTMFHHQTLGLARLIREGAKAAGVTVQFLGSACEDEVNKENMKVEAGYLSHFLVFYLIEQLWGEQNNIQLPQRDFAYLLRSEIDEIRAVVARFDDRELARLCEEAVQVFNWQYPSPAWKMRYLRTAQYRLRRLVRARYDETAHQAPLTGPRKVAMPNVSLSPLRGDEGGKYGQVA